MKMVVWVKHLGWVWRILIVLGVVAIAGGAFVGVQYATAASLGGVSPEEATFVATGDVVLAVSIPDVTVDPESVQFVVDGKLVPAASVEVGPGQVRTKMPLADGQHTAGFTVTSSNLFARKLDRSWSFTVDTVAPAIDVVTPATLEATPKPKVDVKVEFQEPVEAQLTVDGQEVPLNLQGTTATASATLEEGPHAFAVVAKDRAGNTNTQKWDTYADFVAPTLGLTYWPSEPWSVSQARVVFEAQDNHLDGVKVTATVDGTEVPAKAGSTVGVGRKYSIETGQLAEGKHTVELTATDRGGNTTVHTKNVLVDTTELFGTRDMAEGAQGRDVKTLEQILKRKGVLKVDPDETWDAETTAALLEYKQSRTLDPSSVVDKATRTLMLGAIKIDISERKLYYYDEGKLSKTYSVAVGQPRYPTPTGHYQIVVKEYNPTWSPPPSPWATGLEPVPPGPGNPLGTRWMGLSAQYVGIHGTYNDGSIGTAASHGCIRMHIWENEKLFELVYVGTPVDIVR